MEKKTKIVCTMGPNENDQAVVEKLIAKGMDVARFNFSHGSYDEQAQRIAVLKSARIKTGVPVAMLLDTKGPEIRTGKLRDGKPVVLKEGGEFILTSDEIEGNENRVSISYKNLPNEIKRGDSILIDDGELELKVESIDGNDIHGRVVNGGELGQQKGVNIPNVHVNLPDITEKDKEDIIWGIAQGFDIIAASFVRSASAVREIKDLLKAHHSDIPVFAKIENKEGVANIDSIIREADGIMVARGDLGVEVAVFEVPPIQKMIIEKCNLAYKPVITATQMLDSMIRNPRPTRAEVTDVANAVYDGTDAVMLSGETAVGKYAVEAVGMMADIVRNSEKYYDETKYIAHRKMDMSADISSAVGLASVRTARNIGAAAIVTPSASGQTARLISNFRPKMPIYAVTPNEWAMRRMMVCWGVKPLLGEPKESSGAIVANAVETVRNAGYLKPGDKVVVTAGDPVTNYVQGTGHVTNMLYVIEAK
ncbi:MAG: pyruvate kinase [Lachnospiraceae bacterium]|jgi:pyruvate kinase|nr:pyruvate kinase [Lachnospiraceae bacterium]